MFPPWRRLFFWGKNWGILWTCSIKFLFRQLPLLCPVWACVWKHSERQQGLCLWKPASLLYKQLMLGAEAERIFITSSLITPATYLTRCGPLTQWAPRKELFRISLLQVMRGDGDFFCSLCFSWRKIPWAGGFQPCLPPPLLYLCGKSLYRSHFLRKMISSVFKCIMLSVSVFFSKVGIPSWTQWTLIK